MSHERRMSIKHEQKEGFKVIPLLKPGAQSIVSLVSPNRNPKARTPDTNERRDKASNAPIIREMAQERQIELRY